jgi:mannobiose 2-epimerase
MMTEKNNSTGHVSVNRGWWEQSETVVGYLNAFELTGEEKYLKTAINSWNYIDKYFVDRKNGSWFTSVTPEGTGRGEKVGNWLCPYHNSRMCLEIIERVK